jgi:hypothetical protein
MKLYGYDNASDYLGDLSVRTLPGSNTRIQELGYDIRRPVLNRKLGADECPPLVVVYHSTPVVTFFEDDSVAYYVGRFASATSAQRMRDYGVLGMDVYVDLKASTLRLVAPGPGAYPLVVDHSSLAIWSPVGGFSEVKLGKWEVDPRWS